MSGRTVTTRAPTARGPQRVDHGAVVGAVAGRLDDHVPVEPEEVPQLEQLGLSRVARRVLAFGANGNSAPGPNTWQCASTAPAAARTAAGWEPGERVASQDPSQTPCLQVGVQARIHPAGVVFEHLVLVADAQRVDVAAGGGWPVPITGAYRGLADIAGKPRLASTSRTSTSTPASTTSRGIDLLFKVIEHDNLLFGSEMVGAVRGSPGEPATYFDDTRRYVDALRIGDEDKVFEHNPRRVYPRLDAKPEGKGFCDGSWLATLSPGSQPAAVRAAGGCGRRALPRVRSRRRVPVRPRTQVHAVRRGKAELFKLRGLPRVRQERDRPGDLPRRRQQRHGRRVAGRGRSGARRGHGPTRHHRRRAGGAARCGVRGVRFKTSCAASSIPNRIPIIAASSSGSPGWAGTCAVFRGGRPGRALEVLHVAAHGRGGRPHGAAGT